MQANELEVLTRVPTFAGLAESALASVRALLQPLALDDGATLVELGEASDDLYILAEGTLALGVDHGDGVRWQGRIEAPAVVGEMQLLVGGKRTATLRADGSARVLRWPRADFDACAEQHPEVLQAVIELAHARMQRDVQARAVRAALGSGVEDLAEEVLDRGQLLVLEPGEALFTAGDPAFAWAIVVHGTLVLSRGSKRIAELGSGASLGELELATASPQPHTATALSRTEVLMVDGVDFRELLRRFPEAICARVGRKSLAQVEAEALTSHGRLVVLGASPAADVAGFCRQLAPHLRTLGRVAICDRAAIDAQGLAPSTDSHAPRDPSWTRARLWLERRAQHHEVVVVAVEHGDHSLAELARGWGDHLVVLADACTSPALSELERRMSASAWDQRTLVLLQPESLPHPKGTRAWLDARELDLHLHVRRGDEAHLARVARHLLRRPISLALSGGGGRGFAHFGVVRALTAAGVPVDAICGVSSGAMMGAALAMDGELDELIATYRRLADRPRLLRLVLPIMALVSARPLVEMAAEVYGERDIEDLWLPFCCNAANLTQRRMEVFERGPVGRSVLASSALPGVLPPVVIDHEVFVDGATMLNVPVGLARERWGGRVVAVDLGGLSQVSWAGEDLPTPFRGLLAYLRPSKEPPPSLATTITSALSVSMDAQNLDARARADLLVLPDVQDYPITDFRSLDVLVELGEQATERALASSGFGRG